jgi:hypothetical protein
VTSSVEQSAADRARIASHKFRKNTRLVTCWASTGAICHEHRSEKSAHAYCTWTRNLNPKRYGDLVVMPIDEWRQKFGVQS